MSGFFHGRAALRIARGEIGGFIADVDDVVEFPQGIDHDMVPEHAVLWIDVNQRGKGHDQEVNVGTQGVKGLAGGSHPKSKGIRSGTPVQAARYFSD